MSTLFRPSGPLPPSVYWFRRGLVLVVVVLLLLAARSLLVRATRSAAQTTPPSTSLAPSSSGTAATTSAPATSAPATSAPATSPTPTRSASSPAASSTRSTSPSVPACTSRQIAVTATTDAASYPVGSTPRLRMRIQNTSSTPCSRDIGAAQNTLLITSGGAHVWSSDDCNPGGSPQVVTMAPGQSYSVSVTWLGHLSQKGCPSNQPMAAKGTYKLTGRNGGVVSVPVIFALT